MFCFGKTDHRRPAQVAVVLGAAVWPGNRPSDALLDRVNTGIGLYREGLVDVLLFSGGPSDNESIAHETSVMHDLAVAAGIPEDAIWLDPMGIDTQSTVDNTVAMFRQRGVTQVLAVSHFYHLPRIHMAYGQAGFPVYTVPAAEEHVLLKLPFFLAREVVALWVCYFRPIIE
jgi:vancomycin permeability regulator SanA